MIKLSKNEMKNFKGGYAAATGGSCACLQPTGNAVGGPVVTYGMSSGDAQGCATAFHGRWCCDSCGSASWYGI